MKYIENIMKNKPIDLLFDLKGFKYVTVLVSVFKKIQSNGKIF